MVDLSGQRKDLRALGAFRADPRKPRRPVADDGGHVGEGFNVVNERRHAPQAVFGGVRRAGTGRAASALNAGNQRGFLAANERARTQANVHAETERRATDVGSHQASPFGLTNGCLQARNRQRVFGPHVDVATIRTNRVSRDCHAFQHAVRIGFQHAAIHVRAGVALVGVADDKLAFTVGLGNRTPFQSRRIARAAAPAQAGTHEFINHLRGCSRAEAIQQRSVTTRRDGILEPFRVNQPNVLQDNPLLPREERNVCWAREPFDGFTRKVLDDFGGIVWHDVLVKHP